MGNAEEEEEEELNNLQGSITYVKLPTLTLKTQYFYT